MRLGLLALLLAGAQALTFVVKARERACFFAELEADVSHDADILLLNDGPRGISFRIYDPASTEEHDRTAAGNQDRKGKGAAMGTIKERQRMDQPPPAPEDPRVPVFERIYNNGDASVFNLVEFSVPQQKEYEICLDNDNRFIDQLVGFSMPFHGDDLLIEGEALEGVSKGDMESVRRALRQVQSRLSSIKSSQRQHLQRESVHRATADSNNSRIFYFSLLETAVFLAVSMGQIYMVRRWFNLKPERQWA